MLKLGLIGAGRIGKVHCDTVMTRVQDATIVSVADYYEESAKSLAAQYGISHATSNHRDILENSDVDAVIIASSTDTHSQFIIESAQAGKDIFCEKPIDFNLARIDEAIKAVADAGVKFQVAFQRRFDATFLRVKQAIDNGEVGTPHLLHIISRDPAPPPITYIKVSGGLFFDMTIHDFDMARFLLGEVEEVYAMSANLVDPAIGEAGDIDTAIITLKFANGAMGTIDNSRKAVYGYDQRVEVFGDKGSVTNANQYPDTVTLNTGDSVRRGSLPLNFFLERYAAAYQFELEAFVDCVVNDKPVSVGGADGRAPVVIAMACYKSLKEKRPVKLSEIS
ncbi:MAG: inositol 2-dehydrogenase [Anaerolineae bacterium]|nr:inositol 2-dehydrogenase [Anaerolineae bacterium]